ncbi:MAG TPA: hypothetical protein VI452_16615 [Marmoricola sp.]
MHPHDQAAPATGHLHQVSLRHPQAHLMKLGFEKYFLWKMRHGYVQLP